MKGVSYVLLAAAAAFAVLEAEGCSEFLYNASHWDAAANGPVPVMSGHTMDFASDHQSILEVFPQGTTFQERPALACADCASYKWSNSLGFVAVTVEGMDLATDGINEKGLSAAWLFMPDALTSRDDSSSSSGDVTRDPAPPAVTSICTYILGNFASVNEAREGLKRIQFAAFDDRLLDLVLSQNHIALSKVPLYVSVRDSMGESFVIEFLGGKTMLFHDLERLLAAKSAKSGQTETKRSSKDGAVFRDYQPVYRVQRISAMNHSVRKNSSHAVMPTPAQQVVSSMLHILNAVRRPASESWSLVRDHKSPQLFIRSAQNLQLRRIDLAQIDFASESSRRSIPVAQGDWFIDISRAPVEDASSSKTSASELTEATKLMAQERSPAPVRPHDRLSWFSFVSGVSWGAILTLGAIYGAPWIAMQIRRRKYKQIHDLAYL